MYHRTLSLTRFSSPSHHVSCWARLCLCACVDVLLFMLWSARLRTSRRGTRRFRRGGALDEPLVVFHAGTASPLILLCREPHRAHTAHLSSSSSRCSYRPSPARSGSVARGRGARGRDHYVPVNRNVVNGLLFGGRVLAFWRLQEVRIYVCTHALACTLHTDLLVYVCDGSRRTPTMSKTIS